MTDLLTGVKILILNKEVMKEKTFYKCRNNEAGSDVTQPKTIWRKPAKI